MLLVHGELDRAVAWARRGVVSVHAVPLGAWVALVPAADRSLAAAPYDEPVGPLLARSVPRRLRGAIGVATVGPRVVLSLVPHVLRHTRRWLVWEPGQGLIRVGTLPPGTITDLAATAGAREHAEAVARVLRDVRGSAEQVVADTLAAVRLPGAELVGAPEAAARHTGSVLVEPAEHQVRRFERAAHEDRTWRSEVEGR